MRHAPLAAALILAATFLLHVLAGGPEFDRPFQTHLPDEKLKAMAAVLWHFVSLALAVSAAAAISLARRPNPALALTLAALMAGFAALFLFYGLTRLGTVWTLPQWIIFAAVAPLLLTSGARPQRKAGTT